MAGGTSCSAGAVGETGRITVPPPGTQYGYSAFAVRSGAALRLSNSGAVILSSAEGIVPAPNDLWVTATSRTIVRDTAALQICRTEHTYSHPFIGYREQLVKHLPVAVVCGARGHTV